MACQVTVEDDAVDIRFTGLDTVLCLSRGLRLGFDEITFARVLPAAEASERRSWRVGGGYWPGAVATGWFLVKGAKGERQLWDTYRDREVLVIDTTRPRPRRVVLQHVN